MAENSKSPTCSGEASPSKTSSASTESEVLLDSEGNIQSAQAEKRLSSDVFKIVREKSDPIRSLGSTRDAVRHFNQTNLRLYEQGQRPRWLGRPATPPMLPGSISFSADFHLKWNKTVEKYEKKLHKKIITALPAMLSSLDSI